MWVGATSFNQDMLFISPEEIDPTQKPSTATRTVNGETYLRSPSVWFSSIDHGRRHQPLQLMSMTDNLRFNKKLKGKEKYDRYHNYDAIEVPFTDAIPSDYEGLMGVPISYLDKHNPDQFEIIGSSRTHGERMSEIAAKGSYMQGGPRFYLNNSDGTYERLYDRIVIRKLKS